MSSLYVLMYNFKQMLGFDEIILKFCFEGIIVENIWNLLLDFFLLITFFFKTVFICSPVKPPRCWD